MAGRKGIAATERLRHRPKAQRGGNAKQLDGWRRGAADSLAL